MILRDIVQTSSSDVLEQLGHINRIILWMTEHERINMCHNGIIMLESVRLALEDPQHAEDKLLEERAVRQQNIENL